MGSTAGPIVVGRPWGLLCLRDVQTGLRGLSLWARRSQSPRGWAALGLGRGEEMRTSPEPRREDSIPGRPGQEHPGGGPRGITERRGMWGNSCSW